MTWRTITKEHIDEKIMSLDRIHDTLDAMGVYNTVTVAKEVVGDKEKYRVTRISYNQELLLLNKPMIQLLYEGLL
jgi:hypothetical protein